MRTLHLWSPPLASLQKGKSIILTPEEHHHFSRVLRGKAGQGVVLMDGLGYTVQAECSKAEKKESSFSLLTSPIFHTRTKRVGLAGPIPKGKRFPYLLEKLQEMGVHSYAPLHTEHGIREDWSEETKKRMRDRLIEACKQSRCPHLMILEEAKKLDDWAERQHPLVLEVDAPPLLQTNINESSEMIFGPEAGWSLEERDMFRDQHWPRATLSTQHLRMETAAILGAGTLIQMQDRE